MIKEFWRPALEGQLIFEAVIGTVGRCCLVGVQKWLVTSSGIEV